MTRPATRSTLRLRCAAIAMALTPAPALRAEPPPPVSDEIVVTGQRDREEAIQEFVESMTVETDDQLAAFRSPVCSMSFGLPEAYNEKVASRIRDVAQRAGIPVAAAGCDPNLVVIVADDSAAFFDAFRRDRPTLFQTAALSDIRKVREAEGPVRAWQVVELRGSDGRPVQWVRVQPGGRLRPAVTGVLPSRLLKATRKDLAISFVAFDVAAVDGLTLTQIADHAAMRALAMTSNSVGSAPSILGLFEKGGSRPDALTEWDAAYLKSLYGTSNIVSASQQQANMARLIAREMIDGGDRHQ